MRSLRLSRATRTRFADLADLADTLPGRKKP
jgi:hypothetical protein